MYNIHLLVPEHLKHVHDRWARCRPGCHSGIVIRTEPDTTIDSSGLLDKTDTYPHPTLK